MLICVIPFRHTGELENFNSMMTKYVPKRIAFELVFVKAVISDFCKLYLVYLSLLLTSTIWQLLQWINLCTLYIINIDFDIKN